jgi:hypothetical protein
MRARSIPLATGVLLVCLGQATRVVEYLMASTKTYRAEIRLGLTTDTYDIDGELLTIACRCLSLHSRGICERHCSSSPARSCRRPRLTQPSSRMGCRCIGGRGAGRIFVPTPRPVTIHGIDIVSWQTRLPGRRRQLCGRHIHPQPGSRSGPSFGLRRNAQRLRTDAQW